MALGLVMRAKWSAAAMTAGLVLAGVALAGVAPASADCGWDIRMTISDIAEVEGTIPLAERPHLPLGPGRELPPQRRSTTGGGSAEGIVSGATPSGQEVVPDQVALTGQATEGSVPGPAEEPIARSTAPAQGLMDSPSERNDAARHLVRAKVLVQDAQERLAAGDAEGCYDEVTRAKASVAKARDGITAAAGGRPAAAGQN